MMMHYYGDTYYCYCLVVVLHSYITFGFDVCFTKYALVQFVLVITYLLSCIGFECFKIVFLL